ncbi:MAG: Nif11-like leader peptide family RiPP precursor [Magnetococcales bacterium]|nr:Nif11-like leader peptide family RiPP precursor [Magnetococcales bacterium]
MEQKLVDLYSRIRTDEGLIAQLSSIQEPEEFVRQARTIAEEQGTPLTKEETRTALKEIAALIQASAGEDELTEAELELVAGGAVGECGSVLDKNVKS